MFFEPCSIPDVIQITPNVINDSRGYFIESFHLKKTIDFLGYDVHFCQDNESKSDLGVLRGLHYQMPPYAQTKLVRVIKGKVLDVMVDIRLGSPTFGKSLSIELSDENFKQLFIPRGFAHGFVVLSKICIFSYKVDNYYHKPSERGIHFADKTLNIDWHLEKQNIQVSEKDQNLPKLSELTASELFDFNVNYYA